MRTVLLTTALCVGAVAALTAQDFNWHGRIAAGKRLEVKGVSGDIRAVLASGAEAVVNARKHARRSDPDEVEIKVVESNDGVTICAVYPTPPRARQENTCEAGDGWHCSTVNGGITLILPGKLDTDVRATTVNGDIETDWPLMITGRFSNRRIRGTIGAGGRALSLSTVNGEIRLKKGT